MICRHCLSRSISRPRGLCFSCYYTPHILALYPPQNDFARHGVGVAGKSPVVHALPPEPTSAPPGTPEKVAVLARRAEQGYRLWHPLDRADQEEVRRLCEVLVSEEVDCDDE